MATSVRDFWAFVVFGARPGRALPIVRHVSSHPPGRLAHKTEFRTVGAFYLLIGVGMIMEYAFQRTFDFHCISIHDCALTVLVKISRAAKEADVSFNIYHQI